MNAPTITAPDPRIQQWVDQFNREGYLFLPEVLKSDHIAELKADLERDLADPNQRGAQSSQRDDDQPLRLRTRMFEGSEANRRLFDMEPIISFAEAVVSPICHVIHNNSFITKPGAASLSAWHQDDAPHYLVTHGEPPTNVQLPCLLFTANYYLTDVTKVEHGGTEVIPRSHLFGKACPADLDGTEYRKQAVPCLGKAGSVVMFNNQVWHRGGPNTSDRTRFITQVTYARRIIGHKYYPFMNYQMPEHVYANADPRLRRLLGFLPMGAYG